MRFRLVVTCVSILVAFTPWASHASGQGVCFSPAVNYPAGDYASSVIAADLDGDGDGDLAVSNGWDANVLVLKNSGDGTFVTAGTYAVGISPSSVSAYDLDRDHDVDLAVANLSSANISVLENNGDGTFAVAVNYTTGGWPYSVFAADLDGDSAADLAVADGVNDSISVLKNNGDGTFAAAVDYAAGHHPISVLAADVDGDGDKDLAVANLDSDSVSVLKNNGNGTFAAAVNYAVGDGPLSVFAADLDGDNDVDLAVANGQSDNVSMLKNNGNGTFAAAVNYAVGDYPITVFAADLNGDGDADLAVTNASTDSVSVLKNNGDGTFAGAVNYAAGDYPRSVFAADLDGDNDADLAVANYWSDNVSVLRNGSAPGPCVATLENNVVDNEPGQCGAHVFYTYSGCQNGTSGCRVPPPGTFFPVGTTYVMCSTSFGGCPPLFTCDTFPTGAQGQDIDSIVCMDSSSAGYMFILQAITVRDVEAPVIQCQSDTVVFAAPDENGTFVTFVANAYDNCPAVILQYDPSPGHFFPIGTTPVTCFASDSSGNSDTCSFNVTVSPSPLSRRRIDFFCREGDPPPPPETLLVSGTGGAAWTLQKGGHWLVADKQSGTSPDAIVFTANPTGLVPGVYSAGVALNIVGVGGQAQLVDVYLHVDPSVQVGSNESQAGTVDSIPVFLSQGHDSISGLFIPLSYADTVPLTAKAMSRGFHVDSLRISPYYKGFGVAYIIDPVNQSIVIHRVPIGHEPIPSPDTVDVSLVAMIYYSSVPEAAGQIVVINAASDTCPSWANSSGDSCAIFYTTSDSRIVQPNFSPGYIIINGSSASPSVGGILQSGVTSLLFECMPALPSPEQIELLQLGDDTLNFEIDATDSWLDVSPKSGHTPLDITVTPLECLPGVHVDTIKVTSPQSSQALEIIVTLRSPGSVFEEADHSSIPNAFELSQNYPNPFNSATVVEYAIPKIAAVDLAVYNILGQRVLTLAEGERTPGRYRVTWDTSTGAGSGLASGVYLVRLETRGFSQTRKIILLK